MCGIVSIVAKEAGKLTYKHRKMFEEMLFLDTLRGEDSTGIFAVNKWGNVSWAKEASTPENFLIGKAAKDILTDLPWDYVAAVGHNRKATRGVIKDENAHPFVEENIILVHNGTLTNHKDLNDTVEVDSHAIAHTIKEFGVVEAISKLEGAFAIISYDTEKRQLFVFRNKERPLWMAENDEIVAFASEPWMIFGAAWRNEIKLGKLTEVTPATLLTYDLETFQTNTEEVKLYEKKTLPAIIIPFEKKEEKIKKSLSNPNTLDGFLDRFQKGQPVVFSPISYKPVNIYHQIEGIHNEFGNIRIVSVCSAINYGPNDVKELVKMDRLVATITGVSYNSNTSSMTLFTDEPGPSESIYSANGVEMNEEVIHNLSGTCFRCKEDIDPEELESTYLKISKSGRIVHICPICVGKNLESNPHWGGIKAYEDSIVTVH